MKPTKRDGDRQQRQRYWAMRSMQPVDRVGEAAAEDAEQHQPADRADHVEHGEVTTTPCPARRPAGDTGLLGMAVTSGQLALREPPLEACA